MGAAAAAAVSMDDRLVCELDGDRLRSERCCDHDGEDGAARAHAAEYNDDERLVGDEAVEECALLKSNAGDR